MGGGVGLKWDGADKQHGPAHAWSAAGADAGEASTAAAAAPSAATAAAAAAEVTSFGAAFGFLAGGWGFSITAGL